MKKTNIVKSNLDFNNIMKQGNLYKNKYYALYVTAGKNKYYRFGIAVSKNIGNAVIRNKIKRQVRNIIDKSNIKYKNYDCIVVVRKENLNIKYAEKEKYLLDLLKYLNEEEKNEE